MQIRKDDNGFSFRTEEGIYDLEAQTKWIGHDLLVAIWGGEQPHIGAVALAQSRPSLKNLKITSSTASVICIVGHKEDDVVKKASEFISATLNTCVIVIAGIHWNDIDEMGISAILQNVNSLVKEIVEVLKEDLSSHIVKER
jgi:gallate decarboxylase subunit D